MIKSSGGRNLVLRPGGRAAYYIGSSLQPAIVEVYWRYSNEAPQAARLIGRYIPGQQATLAFNPHVDSNVILSTIATSAAGVRSVRDLRDASEFEVLFQRETSAPTVTQIGASTNTVIQLEIGNYSAFAIRRRVHTADDSAMTVNFAESIIDAAAAGQILSRVVNLTRPSAGSSTRDIWVRISHSSGGDYGAESSAQKFTWANAGNTGGSSGAGSAYGSDFVACFSGNVRIKVAGGEFVSFEQLRQHFGARAFDYGSQPFEIENEAGRQVVSLIVHPGRARVLIDMGHGELVTPEHMLKAGDHWAPALECFPDHERVEYSGDLFNLHVFTTEPTARHYLLENGVIAHNIKSGG